MRNLNSLKALRIFLLFASTRIVLTFGMWLAGQYFSPLPEKLLYWHFSSNELLNYYGSWDTGWYLQIANEGYVHTPLSEGQSNFGFFPMYPLLSKLAGYLFNNNYYGGLLVSNTLTFLSGYYLFLLCLKLWSNTNKAWLATVVFFLFPGSYLLSGMFSEAAFIFFSIACFYYFEKEDYPLSGLAGLCLALTRPFGILILVPLAWRYFQKNGWALHFQLLWLLLTMAGTLLFFSYCYYRTGDFFYYLHAKEAGWNIEQANVFYVLGQGLFNEQNGFWKFNTWYTVVVLLVTLILTRLKNAWLSVWIALLIIAPLQNGYVNIICMPRYILVAFPLSILLSGFTANKVIIKILLIILAVINLVLAAFFSLGYQFAA